jgi:hypothetical protein
MAGKLRASLAVALFASLLAGTTATASTLNVVHGGWCWFGDPRAIGWGDNVYFGWIKGSDGNVEVGRFNLATGGWAQARLHKGLPSDDHSNPTLTMTPSGYLVAFYSPHSGRMTAKEGVRTNLWYRIGLQRGGINTWGAEHHMPTNTRGGLGYTYPTPIWSAYRLYVFWRGGDWNPTYATTRIDFDHWTRARTLLLGMRGERPYIKYDHWGDAIRFAYTGAHPTRRATSLYFGELRGWAVRRADGTPFASRHHLPFRYTRGERIYSWRTAGRAWVWDIAHDSSGHPVVVYAVIRNKYRHSYRYARWNGTRWEDHPLVFSGPHVDSAPGYSGGVTLDHTNPNVVFLSKMTPRRHFELFRWETRDDGRTWLKPQPMTTASDRDNMRPFVPLGMSGDRVLLWLWGKYNHWSDFSDVHVMLRANLSEAALETWGRISAARESSGDSFAAQLLGQP